MSVGRRGEDDISNPGSIEFVRLADLPGLEVMDVRGVSRQWANFHETYTFCVGSWVGGGGEAAWKYRRRTHWMNVDRVQLMEPGEFHTNLTVVPPANFRVLLLSPELVFRAAMSLGWQRTTSLHLKVADLGDGPIRRAVQSVGAAVFERGDAQEAERGLRILLSLLSENACLEQAIPSRPGKPSRQLALRTRELIHEHWAEHLPLVSLSGALGVSIPTIERSFTEAFGTSPRQYQNQVRLMRGKRLLAAPDHSVKTIAKLCGFQDPKYFARLFRREFGQSPERYSRVVREPTKPSPRAPR